MFSRNKASAGTECLKLTLPMKKKKNRYINDKHKVITLFAFAAVSSLNRERDGCWGGGRGEGGTRTVQLTAV